MAGLLVYRYCFQFGAAPQSPAAIRPFFGADVSTPLLAPAAVARPAHRPKLIVGFFFTLVVIHLLAVFAFLPYTFTWWGIAALLVGNFVFGSIGINLAYHRLLTHRAVEFPRWLERTFILCGVCSLEGSPLWW